MTFHDSVSGGEQDPPLGVEPFGQVAVDTIQQADGGSLLVIARDVGVQSNQIRSIRFSFGQYGGRCSRRRSPYSASQAKVTRLLWMR
jgi:hypothetical protein